MNIGGRGRNRTYNLSVKSRMLCQLSYASTLRRRKYTAGLMMGSARFRERPLKNIAQNLLENSGCARGNRASEREGKATLNAAFRLGEIERAAILCNEGTVALREQIANIDQGLHAIGQDVAMNRLPQIEAQVGIG